MSVRAGLVAALSVAAGAAIAAWTWPAAPRPAGHGTRRLEVVVVDALTGAPLHDASVAMQRLGEDAIPLVADGAVHRLSAGETDPREPGGFAQFFDVRAAGRTGLRGTRFDGARETPQCGHARGARIEVPVWPEFTLRLHVTTTVGAPVPGRAMITMSIAGVALGPQSVVLDAHGRADVKGFPNVAGQTLLVGVTALSRTTPPLRIELRPGVSAYDAEIELPAAPDTAGWRIGTPRAHLRTVGSAEVVPGRRVGMGLREPKGHTLDLLVLDAQGRPVPWASVAAASTAHPPWRWASVDGDVQDLAPHTGLDGRLVLHGLPQDGIRIDVAFGELRASGEFVPGSPATLTLPAPR